MITSFFYKITIRRKFNLFHIDLENNYYLSLIDQIKDDVCIIRRFSKDFSKIKILISRLNYNCFAPNIDFEVELDGSISSIDGIYTHDGDFGESLDEKFPTRKVDIKFWDNLTHFANTFPKFDKK